MGGAKEIDNQTRIDSLVTLIETLRGKNGCPWDKKQTPRSMSVYLIEEVYELIEAIEKEKPDDICEELGDVLFHIFFLAMMYDEKEYFNIEDVIHAIVEKMVRRHPHVFGESDINDADEVKEQWHKIKLKEKKDNGGSFLLDSVPETLPALMRAYRISERASKAGFDWNDISGVMKKLAEELDELNTEIEDGNTEKIEMEYGDVLFTLVNIARFLHVHPETALKGATGRFERRFRNMEQVISKRGKTLESVSQHEMDKIWDKHKTNIR